MWGRPPRRRGHGFGDPVPQARPATFALVTTHIMIELWGPPRGSVVAVTGATVAHVESHAMAWARLQLKDGTIVGLADASFKIKDLPIRVGDWFQPWQADDSADADALSDWTAEEPERYGDLLGRARTVEADPFAELFRIDRVTADDSGSVEVQAMATSSVMNWTGSVQGGFLIGLALEAQRLACDRAQPMVWPLRVDATYVLRQAAGLVRCIAKPIHHDKRNRVCSIEIRGEDRRTSVIGLGTSIPVRQARMNSSGPTPGHAPSDEVIIMRGGKVTKVSLLQGVRVLDISDSTAVSIASSILAGLAAEVIRVPEPRVGRTPLDADADAALDALLARGKGEFGVESDGSSTQEQLRSFADHVDVILTSHGPEDLAQMGITFAAIARTNPPVILGISPRSA